MTSRIDQTLRHDGVLIVGAGLAGLSAALAAAPRKALVLSAAPLRNGSGQRELVRLVATLLDSAVAVTTASGTTAPVESVTVP